MKVFISMGMKYKSVAQVRMEMKKVFKDIERKLSYAELIDSVIDGADEIIALDGDDAGMWYLGESIKLMSDADLVFFVGDWQKFRGCRIEHDIAKAYGKFCVEIDYSFI